jgi:hypothetical protein
MIEGTHPTPGVGPKPAPFSILSFRGRVQGNPNTNMTTINPNPNVNVRVKSIPEIEKEKSLDHGPKKMSWGEPTWNLLHVLAEKVKDEHFPAIRSELLEVIYAICSNLPCPDCATHASMYLNDIRYKQIQTKEQLKHMLWAFHNMVNTKKGFPQFPREQLETKYAAYPFIPTLHAFMVKFQDKHRSIRMIADDFHRSKIADKLKKWFNERISSFIV